MVKGLGLESASPSRVVVSVKELLRSAIICGQLVCPSLREWEVLRCGAVGAVSGEALHSPPTSADSYGVFQSPTPFISASSTIRSLSS
jgi:hypothetical protein